MENGRRKLVYVTPALYMAGGVERVLTLKANYLADHLGYDVTIILTEGKGKTFFYSLSAGVKVVNLDIGFEELWHCPFLKKIFVYLGKQRKFRARLKAELMRIRPQVTVSLLRREINFINGIKDGSRKVGELHVNRKNYRNYEENDTNLVKNLFARFWMKSLVRHLRELDRFVVLTEEDRQAWKEIPRVDVIPNPLSFHVKACSRLERKRVIAVGRYVYQKGFDLLLKAWAVVSRECPGWELAIFGAGNREPYMQLAQELGIDMARCSLNNNTQDIRKEYMDSSLLVFSSRYEGFGMVLIEAMACGLPVVSFDCPCGPRDIVSPGVDGVLVPAGDTDALAREMVRLMRSDALLREYAGNAVLKARNYEIEHIASRWAALFDEVCAGQPRGR